MNLNLSKNLNLFSNRSRQQRLSIFDDGKYSLLNRQVVIRDQLHEGFATFPLDKICFSKNTHIAVTQFAIRIREDETYRMESLS